MSWGLLLGVAQQSAIGSSWVPSTRNNPLMNQRKAARPLSQTLCKGVTLVFRDAPHLRHCVQIMTSLIRRGPCPGSSSVHYPNQIRPCHLRCDICTLNVSPHKDSHFRSSGPATCSLYFGAIVGENATTHKDIWPHTSTFGLQPSRDSQHKSGRDVLDVRGTLKYGQFQGMPTSKFLTVLFVYHFVSQVGIGTLCTCLRQFQATFRQFEIFKHLLQLLWPF